MKRYIQASFYKNVPEENKHGDCYKAALEAFKDFYDMGERNIKLVHGVVTGQGVLDGVEYGHAWVEVDDSIVCDYSNGQDIEMPISEYYRIGNVQLTKKYNFDQVANNIMKNGTYGPWDPIFDNYD